MENLVGYAKSDLMVPQAPFGDLAAANAAAAAWCAEVNGAVHSEICAVPAERLVIERELLAPLPSLRASIGRQVTRKVDRLSCVRFASARYSVPVRLIGEQVGLRTDDGRLLVIMTATGQVVAEHVLVAPGEASVRDEHYGGPRPAPRRAVRPKTAAEKEFCALGPVAEAFITGAAAAGHTRLGPELAELNTLRAAHGDEAFAGRAGPGGRVRPVAGRRRPLHPGRRARDGRAPARRGRAGARPARRPGPAAGRLRHRRAVMTAAAPPLAPDLAAGLRRLKLAAMRRLAPELLLTAKTQRWAPEELLRTLVEAEITARDASNARTRLKTAAFPVTKTLDEFDLSASSIPAATFDYLASLEWITARENLCLVGPAGTGKSHLLVALGSRRRPRRAQGPLLHRRRPGRDPLPRPGRQLRRQDHRHPAPQRPDHRRRSRASPRSMTPAPSCCSASSPPPTNAAPWASPATGPSTSGAGSCPSTPPPSASSTACSTTPTSWSPAERKAAVDCRAGAGGGSSGAVSAS